MRYPRTALRHTASAARAVAVAVSLVVALVGAPAFAQAPGQLGVAGVAGQGAAAATGLAAMSPRAGIAAGWLIVVPETGRSRPPVRIRVTGPKQSPKDRAGFLRDFTGSTPAGFLVVPGYYTAVAFGRAVPGGSLQPVKKTTTVLVRARQATTLRVVFRFVPPPVPVDGDLWRVSTTSSGGQAAGESTTASMSGNGTLVAFESSASNLVAGDTNRVGDVFVKNRTSGVTSRLSTSATGAQGNAASSLPNLSADGTTLAFVSSASNLVPGDTNGVLDVFVKDLRSGVITRVSTSSTGAQGTGALEPDAAWPGRPALSGDGSKVVFDSDATNLVEGDTNEARDVFLKDLTSGRTTRINPAGRDGIHPTISTDGSTVAYTSEIDMAPWPNKPSDIYVVNLATGVSTGIRDRRFAGCRCDGPRGQREAPALSADGTKIAFLWSFFLSPDTGWYGPDAYLEDLRTGAFTRVNAGLQWPGAESPYGGATGSLGLSADGQRVFFGFDDESVVDGTSTSRIYLKDLRLGGLPKVVSSRAGALANRASTFSAVSADGSLVAFASAAGNLVPNDTNAANDVFVRRVR